MRLGVLILLLATAIGAPEAIAGDKEDCQSRVVERALKGCTRIVNARGIKRQDLAEAYANRAGAHFDNGDLAAAGLDVEKALEIDPRSGLALSWNGHILNRQRNFKAALASFEKAVSFTPKDSGAWEGRGLSRLLLGDLDGALADANRALQLDPKVAAVYVLRARVRLERNQLPLAFPDIERALALAPRHADAYYFRAQANRKAGQLDKALKDAEKAVELADRDWDNYLLRALVRGETGKPREGIVDIDRVIANMPDNGDAHGTKALLAMAIDDFDTALRHANRSIELKDSQAYEIRGIIYLRLGEHHQAITDLTAHIASKADNGLNALSARGQAYALRGQRDEAIADLEAAIKLSPWLPRERQSHATAKEKLPEIRQGTGAAPKLAETTQPRPNEPDLTAQPSGGTRSSSTGQITSTAALVRGERSGNWTIEVQQSACAIRVDSGQRYVVLRWIDEDDFAVVVSSPAWTLRPAGGDKVSGIALSIDGKPRNHPLAATSIHPRPGAAPTAAGDILLRMRLDAAKALIAGKSLRVTVNGRTEQFDVGGSELPLIRFTACATLAIDDARKAQADAGSPAAELNPLPNARQSSGWVVLGNQTVGYCVLRQQLSQGHVEYRRLADGTTTWTWSDDRHKGGVGKPRDVEVIFDDRPARTWRWQAKAGGSLSVNVSQTWLVTTLPRFERIALRAGNVTATYRYTGFSQGYAVLGTCAR